DADADAEAVAEDLHVEADAEDQPPRLGLLLGAWRRTLDQGRDAAAAAVEGLDADGLAVLHADGEALAGRQGQQRVQPLAQAPAVQPLLAVDPARRRLGLARLQLPPVARRGLGPGTRSAQGQQTHRQHARTHEEPTHEELLAAAQPNVRRISSPAPRPAA